MRRRDWLKLLFDNRKTILVGERFFNLWAFKNDKIESIAEAETLDEK